MSLTASPPADPRTSDPGEYVSVLQDTLSPQPRDTDTFPEDGHGDAPRPLGERCGHAELESSPGTHGAPKQRRGVTGGGEAPSVLRGRRTSGFFLEAGEPRGRPARKEHPLQVNTAAEFWGRMPGGPHPRPFLRPAPRPAGCFHQLAEAETLTHMQAPCHRGDIVTPRVTRYSLRRPFEGVGLASPMSLGIQESTAFLSLMTF